MRRIDRIIVHCSATESGHDVGVREIDRWHRARGWRCIGYHYVVRLDGTVEQGRQEAQTGAHCAGYNAHSIGVCYVGGLSGGLPTDTRTAAQKTAMKKLISELLGRYPGATVHGHMEFAAKVCPCFDAAAEYRDCRGWKSRI